MKPDRKMLISAGVVTAIVVGGVSVTTTASAGRLEQAVKEQADQARAKEAQKKTAPAPTRQPVAPAVEETGMLPEELVDVLPDVVERHLSVDPGATRDYWTTERLQGAEPMPMPQVSISIVAPSD
ncbi:hypothetical protein [Microtetraspora fusca]|uniref:Uncharacterized protein n=1 Tax=Microtetraspora fusca TaxID=1997 RepID=A0ABW6V0Z6_MICFU|nr:hypothetical protein [Microtetraspora fusca]